MRLEAGLGETALYLSSHLLSDVIAPRRLLSVTRSSSASSEPGAIFSTDVKTTREENIATVAMEFTTPIKSWRLSLISNSGSGNWEPATVIRTSEFFLPLLAE